MYAKFRIWDEKYNCWSKESILCYPGEELKKQGRVVQWYTGCKDKDGKEIFEGDIVEQRVDEKSVRGVVKFTNGMFKLSWPLQAYDELGYLFRDYISVVGNVFDNPEMRGEYEPGA